MASYYRDLIRLLTEAGCILIRETGSSHQIWYSPITERRFPVPFNTRDRHTANGILKQAGIKDRL